VISRIITLATDLRDAGSLSIQSEIQKRIYTHTHTRTAVPFNIPVAGGEPITLALKYGNRATGSAYRRLDKRCDARSIGPPTDRGASALARASLLHSASLCLPPPSRTQSARNHLLCTWLEADCYPGILPFLRPAVHRQYRPSRVPPSPSRTWSLRVYFASDWGIQHSSNYNKLNLWRKLDLSFLNQHLTTIFFAFFLMKKNKL